MSLNAWKLGLPILLAVFSVDGIALLVLIPFLQLVRRISVLRRNILVESPRMEEG